MTETPTRPDGRTPVFPPGRYGRRRAPRRPASRWLVSVLAAVILVGLVGIAARLYQQYGDPTYDAQVTRITEQADDHVTIVFTVNVPPGGSAICTVRARGETGAEIGREQVTVRADQGRTRVTVSHRLSTTGRPRAAEVPGCGPVGSR